MTKDEFTVLLELGKVAASIATPIAVAVIGVMLLRRIEGIKATVAKQSEFHKKWAEEFFECGQQFMRAIERDLALLKVLAGLTHLNDAYGTELQREISQLNVTISELGVRIRRSVVFAPGSGKAVVDSSSECIDLLHQLISTLKGNLDAIVEKMNEFNRASRLAHA